MIMKIFSDNSSSTGDDLILAALDDAVKLGADAVNMSLGSAAGFAEYGDEDVEETENTLTYSGVFTRAEAAGVTLMVSAGNETSSTYISPSGTGLTLVEYPDNGIVATPSTLKGSVSVASVANSGYYKNQIMLADGNTYAYDNALDYNTSAYYDILDDLEGQTLEYVVVPGLGEEADFEGLDLTGKVALIARGTINFDVKAANAANAGAVAVIIYNNTNDGTFTAALTTYTIPVIGVAKETGEIMAAAETKTVSFSADYYGSAENPSGGQISSFSSIGPAPDLTIKPEIAAPGGLITSSVIGNTYETMSGTSMAAPHMAGEAALVKQYLKANYADLDLTASELSSITVSLLMSTAEPSVSLESETYFSVRQQGAGIANVYNAIASGAYLSVEGAERPKAELGSSEEGTYTYTVTVHNMTDSDKLYTADTTVLAATVVEYDGTYYVSDDEMELSTEQAAVTYSGLTDGQISVPANGTATFTVTIALTESGKQYFDSNFPNGSYVEGYTFLRNADEDGIDLSLPFLGFYGDWESLTVFDGAPDEAVNLKGTSLADIDSSGYGYYLGINQMSGNYDASRLAFGAQRGSRQLVAQVTLLRNVTSFRETVTDSEGNVIYDTGDQGEQRKTYGASTSSYSTVIYTPGWSGRVMEDGENNAGDWAESDQWYTYTISATAVGATEAQTKSFQVYLDNTSPTVDEVELYEEDGEIYLTGLVSDNFYLQRLRVIDSTQTYYYLAAYEEFEAVTEQGSTVRFTFNVSELAAELSADGKNPGRVGLALEDTAYNEVIVFVDIGPQSITLESTSVEVGESKQIEVSIKPTRLADSTTLTWASEDESIATVDENGVVTGVADGVVTITATAPAGLTGYAQVTVGKGETVELNYQEAPYLNDRFDTEDGFSWKVTGPDSVQLVKGGTSTRGYPNMSGDIVIPSTVEYNGVTFNVTSIGVQAFYINTGITSVVIPEGVTTIGYQAFASCSKLTNVSLPDSLEYVDGYAFCTYRNTEFDKVPSSLTWIGDYTFYMAGFDAVDLPDTLTHIGDNAFAQSTLTTVTIPESVTYFGRNIFYSCASLSYVELPSNLTEVPENMFYSCGSLKRIVIPNSVERIDDGAFYGSGLEKITFPASVKEIGTWAFAWLTNMTTINIPDTVETIDSYAFMYCSGVETVNIGSGIVSIGSDAFYTWQVNMGSAPEMNVTSESTAAALRRSGYGQEILLNGVPYTGYSGTSFSDDLFTYMPISDTEVQIIAFNDSTGDTEVTIPSTVYCEGDDITYTVTSVLARVFFQNQSIYKLTIADTITYISERAFDQMFNVTEFNVPANLTTLGYQGLGYLGWDAASIGLTVNTENALVVPGTLEDWGDCGFAGNKTSTVIVEEGVTEIGKYGLYGMSNLTSVTLPSTLEKISDFAFQGCSSLTSIDIPDSVTYIGDKAFTSVPLESVELPENLEYLGRNALGAYVYSSDYTYKYWAGPKYVELNGSLKMMGFEAVCDDAVVVAVTNSQSNMAVLYNDLEEIPIVRWDGKTDIEYNDGSCIPEDCTVTVSGTVTIDGKLTIEGTLVVPCGAELVIGDNAVIIGEENIVYEDHEFGDAEFTWSGDYTTVTASFTCANCGAVEVVAATVTTETTEVTCNTDGVIVYTATVEFNGKTWSDTRTVAISATGHTPAEAVIENEVAATCTTDGSYDTVVYCSVCGSELSRTTTVIPATGHSYGEPEFTWSEDYTTVTATITCSACGDEVTETAEVSTVAAYEDAQITYTATVEINGETYTDTKTVIVENPFTDVDEDDYFYAPVLWAIYNGITTGTSDTTFSPFVTAERCQVVTFLWRAAGCPEVDEDVENPFTDVTEDDYFYTAVLWAVENGITTGTSDTTFSPYDLCERCQVVTFLYRYFGQPEVTATENPFTDVDTDDYFYNAVLWAMENGITTGTTENTFGPFVTCERCMVVTFLYRVLVE